MKAGFFAFSFLCFVLKWKYSAYGDDTMQPVWSFLSAAVLIAALILLIAYLCFRKAFYAPQSKKPDEAEYRLPKGKIYEPYRDTMLEWIKEMRALPHEDLQITSFDGLTLCARYFEKYPGAPIELMFHGYRGSAESDLCGGVQRCFALGHNAFVVDQRTAGRSEGEVISFGINESRDCHSWLEFMGRRFGPDARIILTGISMGAATVMMAAGKPLPDTVVGVLADCGYTSPKAIIRKVIRDMKLPPGPAYPFVRLGAKLFGHFDPEADAPVEAMARCRVPVIFFHGEEDAFVPCDMSRENYAACKAPKMLVTTPGAGHGLCYMVQPEAYLDALREFYDPGWKSRD